MQKQKLSPTIHQHSPIQKADICEMHHHDSFPSYEHIFLFLGNNAYIILFTKYKEYTLGSYGKTTSTIFNTKQTSSIFLSLSNINSKNDFQPHPNPLSINPHYNCSFLCSSNSHKQINKITCQHICNHQNMKPCYPKNKF